MTVLRPMRQSTYPAYLQAAISGYAQDNVAAGRWAEIGAPERSRDEFQKLLPDGLDTPGQVLCEIAESDAGPALGFVWYAVETQHGSCTAYIFDVEVKAEHRRKGTCSARAETSRVDGCGSGRHQHRPERVLQQPRRASALPQARLCADQLQHAQAACPGEHLTRLRHELRQR